MNALTTREQIIQQPHLLNCRFWCAYRDRVSDTSRLRDNYHIPDTTIEQSQQQLADFLDSFSRSGCNIEFWFSDKLRPAKGGYRIMLNFTGDVASVGSSNSNPAINVQDQINAALDQYKRDQEIQLRMQNIIDENNRLKSENEELNRPLNRILQRLDPFIEPIIDSVFKTNFTATNMAKTTAIGNTSNELDEKEKRIASALEILMDGDPDFDMVLMKLADLKIKNPSKYNMAKSML